MNQHKNNSVQLEQQVEQSIRQLLEKYKGLDCLADEMLRRQANSESIEGQMKQLNQGKSEIQEIEEQSRGVKEQYRNSQPQASEAISNLTKQTAELLLGTIKKIDDHNYEGTASDVVGTAKGFSYGPAFKFEYVLLVPVKGKNIKITFDDWIFKQDERVAINRATMTKFGIKVAELTVMFVKD